jgi:hypothetical protein
MLKKLNSLALLALVIVAISGCSGTKPISNNANKPIIKAPVTAKVKDVPVLYEKRSPKKNHRQNNGDRSFNNKLSNAALGRLRSRVRYDGSYVKIAYPGGDVPQNMGVCTDVVIRSYRKLGIDLQEQVHRDMSAAFNAYPNPRKWGLSRPDTNIDHRRVYNLRQFFARRGAALPISRNPNNYKPGDLVTWMVGPDLPHIGVVVNRRSKADPNRYMIVHNIAEGPKMEDILFRFPITGHYRYTPAHMGNIPQAVQYASHRKAPQQRNAMSYAQLVDAANLLGTGPARAKDVKKAASNLSVLDQVVKIDSVPTTPIKAKSNSMKLATLSKKDVQTLLAR